jgi:tetratricopeptide (TPR) repeat protein
MIFTGKGGGIEGYDTCRGGSQGRGARLLPTRRFCLICILFLAGCAPKIVSIKVSDADIVQAAEAAQEADSAFIRKDYYTALIKYLQSTRLNPNSDYVWNKLGITYTQLRYFPEASDAFKRAIAISPKSAHTYNNLGSVYFAQVDYMMAEKLFKKAISLNSQTPTFHLNLGRLYLEKGKKEKAMAELRKAVALDPTVLEKQGNITISAVSNRSPSGDASYSMARIYGSIGDAVHAVASLQEALNAGYVNIDAIQREPDFDPIRDNDLFIAFMKTASLVLKP